MALLRLEPFEEEETACSPPTEEVVNAAEFRGVAYTVGVDRLMICCYVQRDSTET